MVSPYGRYKDKLANITEHYRDCPYRDTTIPINECPCTCYEKQVFDIGVLAGKELARKS